MERQNDCCVEDINHSDGQDDDGCWLLSQLPLGPQHHEGDGVEDEAQHSNNSTGVSSYSTVCIGYHVQDIMCRISCAEYHVYVEDLLS